MVVRCPLLIGCSGSAAVIDADFFPSQRRVDLGSWWSDGQASSDL